ncbi:MAG: MotA/TolQ/ExbB proton channel family protein [Planctomycetota bacterium]
MIELFLRGGLLFMVPLLAASVFVFAVVVERSLRFRRAHVDYGDFRDGIHEVLRAEGLRPAQEWARSVPGPVARLWDEGLAAARQPIPVVRERCESVARQELVRLERFLPTLSLIAQVAPLVGILGTVSGMIVAFQGVDGGLALGHGLRGEQLAGGIWKALVTTAAGLLVAIPASIAHHYLLGRVDRFVHDLELALADVTVFLSAHRTVPTRSEVGRLGQRAIVPAEPS